MQIDIKAPYKKEVADNIKKLLKQKDITQRQLSELSGVAKSTISDYINEKTLPSPGNLQKIADAFNVPKSAIDPRFSSARLDDKAEEDTADFADILNDPDFELFFHELKDSPEENRKKALEFLKFLNKQEDFKK